MLDTLFTRRPMTALFLSIALFITLDLSVLVFNFWIAREVDHDTVAINLAGRQRMLSQRMTKSALQWHNARDAAEQDAARQSLLEATKRFDETLQALMSGGGATAGDGTLIMLGRVNDPQAQQLLHALAQLWPRVLTSIAPLARSDSHADLDVATQSLQTHSETLLDLANRLTTRLEAASGERTRTLRNVQATAFVLAMVNFFVLLAQAGRRYRTAAQAGERLHHLIDGVHAGVCLADARGRIVAANSAVSGLLGRPAAELLGRRLGDFLFENGDVWVCERPDGSRIFAELHRSTISEPDADLEVQTLLDVTERLQRERRLHELAHHDPLTGLPNRRLFEDRIAIAIAQAQRNAQQLGVAMVDLDGFKQINDRHGHAVGDAILHAVAQRLQACARAGDTVARLGGDEFVCLFTGITGRTHLENLGARLTEALLTPSAQDNVSEPIHASIGLALFPFDADQLSALLAHADSRMYQAKMNNRARSEDY